jgi:hypothetical protein
VGSYLPPQLAGTLSQRVRANVSRIRTGRMEERRA